MTETPSSRRLSQIATGSPTCNRVWFGTLLSQE